jgi:hypothetical protein
MYFIHQNDRFLGVHLGGLCSYVRKTDPLEHHDVILMAQRYVFISRKLTNFDFLENAEKRWIFIGFLQQICLNV